jgi:probable HAF family extracellular repeat protein
MNTVRHLLSYALALTGLFVGTVRAEILYNVTDLGVFGGQSSGAYGVNNPGTVVGFSTTSTLSTSTEHAFTYDATMHDLGTLGGSRTRPTDINDNGVVVGTASDINGASYAFIYDGSLHSIGNLGFSGSTSAYSINNNGQVVGSAESSSGYTHAFLYDGTMHDIDPHVDGNTWSEAMAINNFGNAIINTNKGPYLYSSSTATNTHLTDILDPNGIWKSLSVVGINDSGEIVGSGFPWSDTHSHAFLYDGALHDLGTLAPTTHTSEAQLVSVNSSGVAVGTGIGYDFVPTPGYIWPGINYRALYFSSATGLIDLNTLVPTSDWTIQNALAINDSGQIAAIAAKGGIGHAILLTPVPEPSAWAFIALGLVGAFNLRHRVRHRKPEPFVDKVYQWPT